MLPQTSDERLQISGPGESGERVQTAACTRSQSRGTFGMKFQSDGTASGHPGFGAPADVRCRLWDFTLGVLPTSQLGWPVPKELLPSPAP